MTRDEIFQNLKDILTRLNVSTADKINSVTEDTKLTTDLGLNSVGVLYVVIAIEEIFDIRFKNVSFSQFNTVSDVIDYIEETI